MQNKGIVKVFAVIFILLSLYELSFTYFANKVESEAKEAYQAGETGSVESYLDSVGNTSVFPGITYNDAKVKQMNLGLDLKGGINVVLEVSVEDLIANMVGDKNDPIFQQSLLSAKQKSKSSEASFLDLFLESFNEVSNGAKLHEPRFFGTQELSGKFSKFDAPDDEVIDIIKAETKGAIDRAFTILRARIDKFGVVQPNIQKLQNSDRILIELPGVKNVERVKNLLKSTAQLEFWETQNAAEYGTFLQDVNAYLVAQQTDEKEEEGVTPETSESDMLSDQEDEDKTSDDILDILNTDVDSANVDLAQDSLEAQAEFAKTSPFFQIFLPNLDRQTNTIFPSALLGFAASKDTSEINEILNTPAVRRLLPNTLRYTNFAWSAQSINAEGDMYELVLLKSNRDNTPALDGGVVVDASSYTEPSGRVVVDMSMNSEGAQKWKRVTKANINRQVAVVLDGFVYSYPNVNQEIPNGRSQISGSFSLTEGKDLANILKAGKLPARTRIIQAEEVGASLGEKAQKAGLISFIIALIFILIYMLFYYAKAGIAANIALVLNMLVIFGILAGLGAVLTLPGIAGIVLTIGMSVDANVLIFERIKEELELGKTGKAAIADGYRSAYAAIIDANITTLLTGIILAVVGTGPIRGFATTLIIGIVVSFFAAIFITRLVLDSSVKKGKKLSFYTGMTKNLFQNWDVKFLEKKKVAFMISGLVILLGIGSMVTKDRAFDWGVDFTGGRSYVIALDEGIATDAIRSTLGGVFVDDQGSPQPPIVKTFGTDGKVKITTKYLIDEEDAEDRVESALVSGLESLGTPYEIESAQLVGPTIADDIKRNAFWAISGSLLVIFLYIFSRFGRWQFSLGAVVAVFHDVLLVLSVFSLLYGVLPFSLEIDQAFIAAILTVIGYSLNDTVVVFDRIRERVNSVKDLKDKSFINRALNSTLSRTVNTSLTTLLVLLIIFFLGGEVIRGFMFALIVGVIVGTYSSLFIATPVLMDAVKSEEE